MKNMKTIIGRDNKIYDAFVKNPFCGLVEITIYEVKRPDRKIFGRCKWECYERTIDIDEFQSIDEAILFVLEKWIKEKERDTERQRKWKEFEKEC